MIGHFVFPWVLYIGSVFLGCLIWWRWYYYKRPLYQYPLVKLLLKRTNRNYAWGRKGAIVIRALLMLMLLGALARFQTTDEKAKIPVQGIDIMIALDVSESMTLYDDLNDMRSRREVACTALLPFIEKRTYDPMGLVLFGAAAVSRCPLTLDKHLLKELVKEATVQATLNPQGTLLCTALSMAANRLRHSSAATKIIILVTDGVPTEGDIAPEFALNVIKNLGIRVYVIGVGSSGGYVRSPFGFIQQQTALNSALLGHIATETGGQFFQAHKPADLERIYEHIDSLEKSDHTLEYAYYDDWFILFLIFVALLYSLEIILFACGWLTI